MTYLLMYLEFLVSFNRDLPSICSGIVIPAMSRIVGARSMTMYDIPVNVSRVPGEFQQRSAFHMFWYSNPSHV